MCVCVCVCVCVVVVFCCGQRRSWHWYEVYLWWKHSKTCLIYSHWSSKLHGRVFTLLPSWKVRQVIVMRCHFAWVCMYVYICMYIRRLRNVTLCLCMYIRNACTTIPQFSGKNVFPGMITILDYCLACVAHILWKNTTTSVSSPFPVHCALHTISVTLWRYTLNLLSVLLFERKYSIAEFSRDSRPNGRTSWGCARFNCYSPRRMTHII